MSGTPSPGPPQGQPLAAPAIPADVPAWLRSVLPTLRQAADLPPAHAREYLSDDHLTVRPSLAHQTLGRVRPHLVDDAVDWFRTFVPPPRPLRRSAVLVLFATATRRTGGHAAPASYGCDVLLTERAAEMRSHAAQVVCPGGHLDPGDVGPIGAALREAREEVGLDIETVEVVAELPGLYLTPTGTAVIPVLAWWSRPHPVGVVDPREVARVARIDLDHLLDPGNRFTVIGPMGFRGPGFSVDGLFVWGFTANLLDHVFELAGIAPPWDESRIRPLPPHLAAAYWPR